MTHDRSLRIVHCVRAPIGGIFRHIADLAKAQSAAGHRVGVICDSSTGGTFEDSRIESLRPFLQLGITRIPMRRNIAPSDMAALWRVLKHVRTLQPHVLHAHGAKGGAYARIIGTLLRLTGAEVARVYCPHGGSLHFDEKSTRGRLYFGLERALETMTDGLAFVSAYEADRYAEKVGEPFVPNRIIYNGLGADEFEPVEPADNARDFLYIGMMRDLKGPDVFLRALAQLKDSRRTAPTAHLVGDGEDKARYEAMAHELGLAGSVTFHSAMPARRAFAMARCVVVPSRAESMPYIVLEAIAARKPIVATDVGGIPEIFRDEANQLAEPGDPSALAYRMAEQLSDPERYQVAALQRGKRLRERFSVEVMARNMECLYRDLLIEIDAGLECLSLTSSDQREIEIKHSMGKIRYR